MGNKVQVERVSIRNILAIESLEFQPGAVTVIEARNAGGKTSVLEALRSALGGGNDATLLRQGSEKGEVVIEFDDGSKLTERITPSGTRREIVDRDGIKVSKPAAYLKRLHDVLSLNPIRFLEDDDRKRIETLAKALPEPPSREAIEKRAGVELSSGCHPSGSALDVLAIAEADYYDRRRDVNIELRQAKETIASLEGSVPEDAGDEERLEAELETARTDFLSEEIARDDELANVNEDLRVAQAAARDLHDSEVEEARKAFEAAKAAAASKRDESLMAAQHTRNEAAQTIHDHAAPRLAELKAKAARIEERLAAAQRAAGTLEVLEATRKKAARTEVLSKSLDVAVEAIRSYRAELLEDLPIAGLEVRGGAIFYQGTPFDRLEESRRVWLAVQIALLRAGDLNLVCVDGLERLDSDRFALFCDALISSGAQLIGARVTDSDKLRVTTPGLD